MNENLLKEILAELLKDSIVRLENDLKRSDNKEVKKEIDEKLLRYAGYFCKVEKDRNLIRGIIRIMGERNEKK